MSANGKHIFRISDDGKSYHVYRSLEASTEVYCEVHQERLVAESGFFKAIIRHQNKETETGIITLHDDNFRGMSILLRGLIRDNTVAYLRHWVKSAIGGGIVHLETTFSNIETLLQLYVITDKYDVPALCAVLAEDLLLKMFTHGWAHHDRGLPGLNAVVFDKLFREHIYKVFGTVPYDLRSLFLSALRHYKTKEPDSEVLWDLVRETEDFELMHFLLSAMANNWKTAEDGRKAAAKEAEQSSNMSIMLREVASIHEANHTKAEEIVKEKIKEVVGLRMRYRTHMSELEKQRKELVDQKAKLDDQSRELAKQREIIVEQRRKIRELEAMTTAVNCVVPDGLSIKGERC